MGGSVIKPKPQVSVIYRLPGQVVRDIAELVNEMPGLFPPISGDTRIIWLCSAGAGR